jgi:hypothetical protein
MDSRDRGRDCSGQFERYRDDRYLSVTSGSTRGLSGGLQFNPRINLGPDARETVAREHWRMTFRCSKNSGKGNLMILVIRALVKMIRNYKASQQQVARHR